MTNTLAVCLLSAALLCCAAPSFARQLPKECSKGPTYWCESLRTAADCGAVGHCTVTVWETREVDVRPNEVSDKIVRLFRELKDVKDLINEDYLATRIASACKDLPVPAAAQLCRQSTAHMETYLMHVLASNSSAETMCRVLGLCNSEKLDNIVGLNKKKIGVVTKPATAKPDKPVLLGAQKCTWGPSYWCTSISTGHECHATKHCIDRVWSKMAVQPDTDSICKICTDMVTQARDQLQSNETQEELKEVFEGSCKLIPIKVVAKECMKMADEFVPDLVETLASQMNPQMVCSVAGLCNSERIDRLLEEYNAELKKRVECKNCHKAVGGLRTRFDQASDDDFLVGLLRACRAAGSFSDACSTLMFTHFEEIRGAVKSDFRPDGMCLLSGQCAVLNHQHDEFTFPVEVTDLTVQNDDVPCELCEQLVVHLRDVLVANTTELQFEKVLQGLCRQTGNFKEECKSLVEQYYPVMYNYLIAELQPKEICQTMGVCGDKLDVPIAPLVPKELAVRIMGSQLIGGEESRINSMKTPTTNVRVLGPEPAAVPLPIERMFVQLPQSKAACSFCEYFLHYLQVELSDTRTEEQIQDVVDKACDRLPNQVNGECKQFVTEYGPAVIALLVQEIDPSSVCPALGLCEQTHEVRRVSINSQKTNCPLCLFAVEQLETMLKNNRTETSIRTALDNLCAHLSTKLRTECTDFVDTYSSQLVEMLVANMDAQEICVYLKLCSDNVNTDPLKLSQSAIDKYHEQPLLMADRNNHKRPMLPKNMLETGKGGDIETNEIPDNTVNGRPVRPSLSANGACVVCEFVLKEIDDQIKDKHNDDEIKRVVHGVCKHMPKSVRADCDQFVEKYSDLVISLLAQDLDPSEVCRELRLCPKQTRTVQLEQVKSDVLDCAVCETVVVAVKKVLANDKMDRNIVHIVEKSCALLPAKYYDRCHTMLEIYGDSVIHLIEELGTKGVCQKIGLCAARAGRYVDMYKENSKH